MIAIKKRFLLIDVGHVIYRESYYKELSLYYDFQVVCSETKLSLGFNSFLPDGIIAKTLKEKSLFNGKLLYQDRLFQVIKNFNPQIIICGLGNRYLNQWLLMVYCKVKGIDLYIHGHGPYNKTRNLCIYRLIYETILFFCKGFICYTRYSLDSFNKLGIFSGKLSVAENTLNNEYPVQPDKKKYNETGILFIGRIREGSGLEILIESIRRLNSTGYGAVLHVIGDGNRKTSLVEKCVNEPSIVWYGKIFDQEKIAEISKKCFIGCYPGSAGLSIVHYFSLSLPTIIHNDISEHGPEASYIRDNYNGLIFQKKNSESLTEKLIFAFENRKEVQKMGFNAYKDYLDLQSPSLALKFYNIIEGDTVKQSTTL